MQCSDWNAVSFGDDCVIDGFLQFHAFENMMLKVKRTHIHDGCTVAFGATVMGGAVIERDTTLLPLSLVLKEMNMITATYEGSPAEPVSGSTLLPRSLCDEEAVSLSNSPEKASIDEKDRDFTKVTCPQMTRDNSEWVNGLFAASAADLTAGASQSCGSRSVCACFARSRGIMALRVSPVGYRVAEGGALCNGRRQGSFQTTARISSLLWSPPARITAALIADSFPGDRERASLPSRFAKRPL
jgi:hypothetical protein